jgi:hypothetical protein
MQKAQKPKEIKTNSYIRRIEKRKTIKLSQSKEATESLKTVKKNGNGSEIRKKQSFKYFEKVL